MHCHPARLLACIRRSARRDAQGFATRPSTRELRALNQRVRAFALQYLTGGPSVDWVARFVASGRRRHRAAPYRSDGRQSGGGVLVPLRVVRARRIDHPARAVSCAYPRSWLWMGACAARISTCGMHLPTATTSQARPAVRLCFYSAGVSEWTARYDGWIGDPSINAVVSRPRHAGPSPDRGPPGAVESHRETVEQRGQTATFESAGQRLS